MSKNSLRATFYDSFHRLSYNISCFEHLAASSADKSCKKFLYFIAARKRSQQLLLTELARVYDVTIDLHQQPRTGLPEISLTAETAEIRDTVFFQASDESRRHLGHLLMRSLSEVTDQDRSVIEALIEFEQDFLSDLETEYRSSIINGNHLPAGNEMRDHFGKIPVFSLTD